MSGIDIVTLAVEVIAVRLGTNKHVPLVCRSRERHVKLIFLSCPLPKTSVNITDELS